MKKNLRIVSVAAAALLAVAPVVSSTLPVNADTAVNIGSSNSTGSNAGTTTTQAPANRPYFTFNGAVVDEATQNNPSANVIRTTVNIKSGDKVSSVISDITKSVLFHKDNNSGGDTIKINESDFIKELENHQITVKYVDSNNKEVKAGTNGAIAVINKVAGGSFNFTLTGTGANNQTAAVQIPVVATASTTTPTTNDAPVFSWSLNGSTQTSSLNGQVFQVAVGSTFNPTNFTNSNGEPIVISASQNSNNTTTYASIEATSNSVNTSEAGRYYNVTLTATSLTGKKSTATYTVLITSSRQQTLYANGASSIATYNIYGNNVLSGSTTFKDGDKVYVADQTRTINNVSYSQVSPKSKSDAASSNIWVKTSSLVKPAVTEKSETHTVMVASKAYDKNGNYLGHDYGLYTSIDIVPTVVTINGKTYYKVVGKDEYVRVTNITGTQRRLRHNAYIYWSSYRRTPGTGKMYKGQTVTTYGASIRFKNGKKYYRIQGCRNNNKRYIKAVNFY